MYYNFIRIIKELYEVMDKVDVQYHCTLKLMLDESVMHFLEAHKVPFEKQGEFLSVMLYDCPKAIADYKTRKFNV